jgi:FeS assembly protein SufD
MAHPTLEAEAGRSALLPDTTQFVFSKRAVFNSHDPFSEFQSEVRAALSLMSPPSSSEELWRYTQPRLFSWGALALHTSAHGVVVGEIPQNVSRARLRSLERVHAEEYLSCLRNTLRSSSLWSEIFVAAIVDDIDCIEVAPHQDSSRVITLSSLKGNDNFTSSSGCVVIRIQEGASITIVDDISEALPLSLRLFSIHIGDRASLTWISHQRTSKTSETVDRTVFHLHGHARLSASFLATGARSARHDIACVLEKPFADAQLLLLTALREAQHTDFHTEQIHRAPHCRSDLLIKNLVKDKARAVFYGYIKVGTDAQKTDAYQTNKNLLLSSEARVDSIPNLEILANDVKCSHGSSTGQVSREEIFYLMSRGLSEKQARTLLIEGFILEALQRVSNKEWSDKLAQRVLDALS